MRNPEVLGENETEPNGMEAGKHQSNSNKVSIISSSVCRGLQSPEKCGMLFHGAVLQAHGSHQWYLS